VRLDRGAVCLRLFDPLRTFLASTATAQTPP
jgi:hypothetical protein